MTAKSALIASKASPRGACPYFPPLLRNCLKMRYL